MDCICIILIVSAVGKYAEMIPESFRVGFFVYRNSSREEFSCLKQRAICGIQFIRRISNFCQIKYIRSERFRMWNGKTAIERDYKYRRKKK